MSILTPINVFFNKVQSYDLFDSSKSMFKCAVYLKMSSLLPHILSPEETAKAIRIFFKLFIRHTGTVVYSDHRNWGL